MFFRLPYLLVCLLLGISLGLPGFTCTTSIINMQLHKAQEEMCDIYTYVYMCNYCKPIDVLFVQLCIYLHLVLMTCKSFLDKWMLPSACLASLPVTLARFFFTPPANESPAPSAYPLVCRTRRLNTPTRGDREGGSRPYERHIPLPPEPRRLPLCVPFCLRTTTRSKDMPALTYSRTRWRLGCDHTVGSPLVRH